MHSLIQVGVLILLGALFGNGCVCRACAYEGTKAVKCILQEEGCGKLSSDSDPGYKTFPMLACLKPRALHTLNGHAEPWFRNQCTPY